MIHTDGVSEPNPRPPLTARRGCLWPIFLLCTVGAVLIGGGLVVKLIGESVPVRMEPQGTDDPAARALARGQQYEQTWKILQGRYSTYTSLSVPAIDGYHGRNPEEPQLSMSSSHREGGDQEGSSSERVRVSISEYADEAQAARVQRQDQELTVTPSIRPGRTPRPCTAGRVSLRVGTAVATGSMPCGDADEATLGRTAELLRRTIETVHATSIPAAHLSGTAEHPIVSRASVWQRTSKYDEQAQIADRPDGLDGEQLLRESVKGTGVQLMFEGSSNVYVYANADAARAALDKQATHADRDVHGPTSAFQPCTVKHSDASLCRTTNQHGRKGTVRWHAVGRYLVMDSQEEGEPSRLYDRQVQWLAEA